MINYDNYRLTATQKAQQIAYSNNTDPQFTALVDTADRAMRLMSLNGCRAKGFLKLNEVWETHANETERMTISQLNATISACRTMLKKMVKQARLATLPGGFGFDELLEENRFGQAVIDGSWKSFRTPLLVSQTAWTRDGLAVHPLYLNDDFTMLVSVQRQMLGMSPKASPASDSNQETRTMTQPTTLSATDAAKMSNKSRERIEALRADPKTYTEYLAELDDLLVEQRGQAMTTEVSLTLAILAGRAVMAARAELLDNIGRPANVRVMNLRPVWPKSSAAE